jgi:hypothetical protein
MSELVSLTGSLWSAWSDFSIVVFLAGVFRWVGLYEDFFLLLEWLAPEKIDAADVFIETAAAAEPQSAILIGVGLNQVIIQWSSNQLEVNEWMLSAVRYEYGSRMYGCVMRGLCRKDQVNVFLSGPSLRAGACPCSPTSPAQARATVGRPLRKLCRPPAGRQAWWSLVTSASRRREVRRMYCLWVWGRRFG